ncbi:hypothetical protein BI364_04565 [Acidihalobacter yilgarnensis]|uniref:Uncharacterized protein n=1 Tax=Acidihalobacter yilgarnensis TaxID=2819280 RepID=A0A1D8ILM9_9GAMM|nr:hypothetical protein BI364_04565 [Acidihalobacter yilgarnensis]
MFGHHPTIALTFIVSSNASALACRCQCPNIHGRAPAAPVFIWLPAVPPREMRVSFTRLTTALLQVWLPWQPQPRVDVRAGACALFSLRVCACLRAEDIKASAGAPITRDADPPHIGQDAGSAERLIAANSENSPQLGQA